MQTNDKRALTLFTMILAFMVGLGTVVNFPRANGVTPVINNTAGSSSSSNASTGASALTVATIGDTIAVLVITSAGTGNCPITVNSVVDTTTGASLTKATENCMFGTTAANNGSPSTGVKSDQSVWYLTGGATAASSQTITITFSSTGQRAAWNMYDISNVSNDPLNSAQVSAAGLTITSGGTQAISTGINQAFSSPAALLAIMEIDSSSTCFNSGSSGTQCANSANLPDSGCSTANCFASLQAGSGFSITATGATISGGSCGSASNNFANSCGGNAFEASTSASISSPTSFPWTAAAASSQTMYNFFWTMTEIAFAASGSTGGCSNTTCFGTIPVTFNFVVVISSFGSSVRHLVATFHMIEQFANTFGVFNGITVKITDAFKFIYGFCVIAFSCKFSIPTVPNTQTYVLYDTPLNFFITGILLPIIIIFAVIVAMKRGADIDERMVLPIALLVILMIAWGGQGLIFPQWVSLMVVLVSGGGLAYTVTRYFTNRGGSEE